MGVGGQPHAPAAYTPGKDPVRIVKEAGLDTELVWTGAENLAPTGIRSPDRPARSQSLYRLRYPATNIKIYLTNICRENIKCFLLFRFVFSCFFLFNVWYPVVFHKISEIKTHKVTQRILLDNKVYCLSLAATCIDPNWLRSHTKYTMKLWRYSILFLYVYVYIMAWW